MQFTIPSTLLLLATSVFAAPHPKSASGDLQDSVNGVVSTTGFENHWIALFHDNHTLDGFFQNMHSKNCSQYTMTHTYNNTAFKGVAGHFPPDHISMMSVMSELKSLERSSEVKLSDVQTNAPWGLQRVSQGSAIANAPQDGVRIAAIDFKYQFEGKVAGLGKDVDIYVIDTGINTKHVDFDGRASFLFAFDGVEADEEGHGTHCAGTIGSTTFGIAKNANIHAVKVLGTSSGSTADIISGIDKMLVNHEKRKGQSNFAGSVASMSLGSPVRSSSLEEAVSQASAQGIHFSVAAGNENQDACNSSPASATKISPIVAVGATTIDDDRASFSNFGKCTTIFAPGQDITSTWTDGANKINTISGTSMACPHVTGLLAYLLSLNPDLKLDPKGLKAKLLQTSIPLKTDKGTVPFANNGFGSTNSTQHLKLRSYRRA
ncbi:peptidase S8/S53 domain-containing protein [Trichophaea hybrida]|nr:peptidase S8/S53 domain-containing protein [Trichophaea hybrida]